MEITMGEHARKDFANMEVKKKVLVADAGEEFRALLVDAISAETDMQVVGTTGDGQELLDMIG